MRLVDRGNSRRVYHCNSCNLTADRDFAACWNMALKYLKNGRGAVRPLLSRRRGEKPQRPALGEE